MWQREGSSMNVFVARVAFNLALAFCFSAFLLPADADNGQQCAVQVSRPYVARAGAWQTWNDHLHIRPGMEKKRLMFVVHNGAEGRQKMTDLRIQLAKKPFITIKDFADDGLLSKPLPADTGVGDTLVTVEGFGPSGARLVWSLNTDRPTITSVTPNPFGLADKVTIGGSNFSDHDKGIKVKIGKQQASVVKSSEQSIEIKMPTHLAGGSHDLIVDVNGAQSAEFKVSAKCSPKITWIDLIAVAPGHPVVITGSGFSKISGENQVMFGEHLAHILSASETSITCETPMMDFPVWHLPITVKTNGMVSKEKKLINIDHRIIENNGVHQY
jgi:IPT/TIG domain